MRTIAAMIVAVMMMTIASPLSSARSSCMTSSIRDATTIITIRVTAAITGNTAAISAGSPIMTMDDTVIMRNIAIDIKNVRNRQKERYLYKVSLFLLVLQNVKV